MGKSLYIAEKPSVAMEFAKALRENMTRNDGYQESEHYVVTWCVGHLVTMSYPEVYDPALKRWSMDTLPFIPDTFKYEVIPSVKKQFKIVSGLLNRKDVDTIYVCTDSGREGEYIYRLVAQMANVKGKAQKRVWIDSQTEEEILRGIREAKDLSEYDNLSESAYLRAKADYLMGINFSRLLTIKYGNSLSNFLGERYCVVAIGRVMTCVLGMIVRREREIRAFVKKPFYRVISLMETGDGKVSMKTELLAHNEKAAYGHAEIPVGQQGGNPEIPGSAGDQGRNPEVPGNAGSQGRNPEVQGNAGSQGGTGSSGRAGFEGEFRAVEGSAYYASPKLYKENGFHTRDDAQEMIDHLRPLLKDGAKVVSLEKKKEKKNPPLLYNLAELQNDCSRRFHISPDQTLNIAQELYEKKLVTYPRTDARVLSTAVAKQIDRNIKGLLHFDPAQPYAQNILDRNAYAGIAKTRYTNDSQITDHYALIPTGQGFGALKGLSGTAFGVYCLIVRRFLSIFYPPAEYQKIAMITQIGTEKFFTNLRVLTEEGYLAVMKDRRKDAGAGTPEDGFNEGNGRADGADAEKEGGSAEGAVGEQESTPALLEALSKLRKGSVVKVNGLVIREGETSPPKRYNSGSMILAMENAGQLIEDEELREQIKGSGIGTSATRAEILKKLVNDKYIALNKKTQILTPTLMGEMIYDVVYYSMASMLSPELTASWEKGLAYVAEGTITPDEYMQKLRGFITKRTSGVQALQNQDMLRACYENDAKYYKAWKSSTSSASQIAGRSTGGAGKSARGAGRSGGSGGSAGGSGRSVGGIG